MKRIFIAGPMTGLPEFNYPAFDDAAHRIKLTHVGANVINPADNHGRQTNLPRWKYIHQTLGQIRELAILQISTPDDAMIVVLDGWTKSPGARLEVEAAHQLGLDIYHLECILDPHWESSCRIIPSLPTEDEPPCRGPVMCEEPHETTEEEDACEAARVADEPIRAQVLDEAKRLICGDRNNQYGSPTQDFNRTANMLTSLGYGKEDHSGGFDVIEDHDVAVIMIALKLSRIMWSEKKLDSWRDIAGYSGCGAEVAGASD